MQSHHVSPKRERRRAAREALLGPERRIVVTSGDVHELECGHGVWVRDDERPHIHRRRCKQCLGRREGMAWGLGRGASTGTKDAGVRSEDGTGLDKFREGVLCSLPQAPSPKPLLDFCEACGAGRAIVPVGGTSGRWCECRECHSLVRAKGMEK